MDLKGRDKDVLNFIKKYMKENGVTPTMREIGSGIGMRSSSSVHGHFMNLVALGYIEQVRDKGDRYKVKGMEYVERD